MAIAMMKPIMQIVFMMKASVVEPASTQKIVQSVSVMKKLH